MLKRFSFNTSTTMTRVTLKPLILILLCSYSFADSFTETEPPHDSNYVLRPYDFICVNVFQEPDMRTEVEISADKSIMLPLIGRVMVAGLTVAKAQGVIEKVYREKNYLVNPHVNIVVVKNAKRKIQVLGQVNNPGPIIIPPDRETLTLTEALSEARGLNLRGNPSSIQVTTKDEQGRKLTNYYNWKNMLNKRGAQDVMLKDGDIVFVQESLF